MAWDGVLYSPRDLARSFGLGCARSHETAFWRFLVLDLLCSIWVELMVEDVYDCKGCLRINAYLMTAFVACLSTPEILLRCPQ